LRRLFVPMWGELLLGDISSREIERAIRGYKYKGQPTSPRTKQRLRAHLSNLFHWAQREGYIEHIPTANVRLPRRKDTKLRVSFTREEASRLLELAPSLGKAIEAFVYVSLFTGLRPMAVLRLRQKFVRFSRNEVVIPPEVNKTGTRLVLPLSSFLKRYLLSHIKAQAVDPEALVVPRERKHFHRGCHQLYEKLAQENEPENPARAEEIRQATLRSLRRTFASLLAPRVSFPVLQRLMGHAPTSGEITWRYIDADWEELKAAVELLPELLLPQRDRAGERKKSC